MNYNIDWCPWCWNFLIKKAFEDAIEELWIDKKNMVVVSGIWCASKIASYVEWYRAETLHGRVLPFSTWVKTANPKLNVISMWWDGDAYNIWIWHLAHAIKRDIDILYIVFDNENFALTTWQDTVTTTWFQPIPFVESLWCKFAYEIQDKNIVNLKEKIIEWINHPWFALINVKQYCPSWKKLRK